MAERYRSEIARLIDSLNSDEHRAEASDIIRSLIDSIVLTPNEKEDRLMINLVGDLAGILSFAADRDKSSVSEDLLNFNLDECEALVEGGRNKRLSADTDDQCEALVAGVGFEPTTFRL